MTTPNPADKATQAATADKPVRRRVSMSLPVRKLEMPDLPGYHLHWFLEGRIPRAMEGGYEFVKSDELPVNQKGVGTDSTISGNADLGTNISVISGEADLQKLVLMKIREEFWREDQRELELRNASVLSGIFRDEKIMGDEKQAAEDRGTNYVDTKRTAVFNRPTRKGSK